MTARGYQASSVSQNWPGQAKDRQARWRRNALSWQHLACKQSQICMPQISRLLSANDSSVKKQENVWVNKNDSDSVSSMRCGHHHGNQPPGGYHAAGLVHDALLVGMAISKHCMYETIQTIKTTNIWPCSSAFVRENKANEFRRYKRMRNRISWCCFYYCGDGCLQVKTLRLCTRSPRQRRCNTHANTQI